MDNNKVTILKFLDTLDMNKVTHHTLSLLFRLLFVDKIMCVNITELVSDYSKMNWLSLNDKCDMMMIDIYNNFKNLTIKFSDGNSLNCLKEILMIKIPHFAEYQFQNELELDTNFDATNTLIKLLYVPNDTEVITSKNFIELFKLMKLWNLIKSFDTMIQFLTIKKNLNSVIKYHYEQNNIKNLMILKEILEEIVIYYDMKVEALSIIDNLIRIVGEFDVLSIYSSNDTLIRCPKNIIKKIPYFKMMLEDCSENENKIQLDIDHKIANSLINLLYFPNDLKLIDENNFIELFKLIDQYLMEDYFDLIFKYLGDTENLKMIVEHELNKNGCENLNILYKILKSVENENNNNNNFSQPETHKKCATLILSNIKIIINEIGDIGIHLLNFINWQQIFTDKQKIKAIEVSKNYELLNISEILPKNIIKFLIEKDFTNNNYFDIGNKICNNETNIYFRVNEYKFVPIASVNELTVITKYFPHMEYLTYDNIPLSILDINKNVITFTFNKTDIKILIGTNLILGSVLSSNDLEDKYCVIKINKLCDNNKCDINNAEYCHPYYGKIFYELVLNMDVSENRTKYSLVWLVTKNYHKVSL